MAEFSRVIIGAMLCLSILLFAGVVESLITRCPSFAINKILPNYLKKARGLHMASEKTGNWLWDREVDYVDLNANNLEPSPTSRTLPLFLLGIYAYMAYL